MRRPLIAMAIGLAAVLLWTALAGPTASAANPQVPGAIFTTLEDGARVNANIYEDKRDVYLDGGPGPNAPQTAAGLPDGNYYFQVTDPSGKTLLSTDPVKCREFRVEDGIIVEYVSAGRTYTKNGPKVYPCNMDGKENGLHDTGYDVDHGALTIQLMPYDNTPNKGGVYKAWATPVGQFVGDPEKVDNPCGSGCFHGFVPAFSKTDNYKVRRGGQFVTPIITVRKFVDTDGDGVWDAGEPEVGTTFFIDGGGWPVSVADPNGVSSDGYTPYQYLPGFAGAYVVTEGLPSGWSQTAAYLDGAAQTVSVDVTVNVAFTSGETHEVVYGNFECFSVSGAKVNDLDGDGVRDEGEPGIPGWTIYLYRGDTLVDTAVTGSDGTYTFTVCAGGDYTVREAEVPGWTATSSASLAFTAASGVDRAGLDFLNFECFTVSGYKYEDTDGDGVHDEGEPGLAGWTIELYRNGGSTPYATTTTGADGFWSFTVCEGGEYTVKEVQQDGWTATGPTSFSFTATSGEDQFGDFLNFELGRICGAKFYDFDHDGVWDSGEVAIEGWKIELYRDGTYVTTVETDAAGEYCFEDLGVGVYEVREVMPNAPGANMAWAQTYPGGDGDHDITATSGFDETADFGNVCEFTESRTWGYWKTHTGYDGPARDATYDLLPANPLDVDVSTPDGDDWIETDEEANWLFDGGAGDVNCSGDCVTLFRAQLLALHMSMLKFDGMAGAVYVYDGDSYSGMTVQEVYDAAVAALNDPTFGDYGSFQQTLDRINNNHNQTAGSHVLVCPEPPTPNYP